MLSNLKFNKYNSDEYKILKNVFEITFCNKMFIDTSICYIIEEYIYQTVTGYYPEENGELTKVVYRMKNNKMNGTFKRWYTSGQLAIQCEFKEGKLDGLYETWYTNGQKQSEEWYKNNLRNGLQRSWYTTGQLFSEYKCINNETDGLYQCWYRNGQKEIESSFKNGISHGLYQRWNTTGQKEKECYYSNGKQNNTILLFKKITHLFNCI